MPPALKTAVLQVRAEPDLVRKAEELGRIWGPVKPLSVSDVIRHCIEAQYETVTRCSRPAKTPTRSSVVT